MELVTPPENPKLNILVYGRGKSGKTSGAGTAPTPIFYVNGDLPNATRRVHRRLGPGKIMEPKMPQFVAGQTPVMDLMVEITKLIADPNCGVETIVIDPYDELYRRLLEEQSNRLVRPTQNTYGDVGKHMERFCRFFCELPHVNCVIVCHELSQKNEQTGGFEKIPFTGTKSGSESAGAILESMVDIIAYAGILPPTEQNPEPRYVAQLAPGEGRTGGDRFAALGPMRIFDIQRWIEVIKEFEAAEDRAGANIGTTPETSGEIFSPEKGWYTPEEASEEPQEPSGDPQSPQEGADTNSTSETPRKARSAA